MGRRIITTGITEEDAKEENFLRPQSLSEFMGQESLKEMLSIYIKAAKMRNDALDHVLLYGPPGLGKTTLAGVIKNEMNTKMHTVSGPSIDKPGDLVNVLNQLQKGDVLFIDEIHRLPRQVEEFLYSAMEDFVVDITFGKGIEARSIRIDLPKFTLIGATTRAGLLTAPLRDRFGITHRMEHYTLDELVLILMRSARVLGCDLSVEGAMELARRSRGTPRIANRLLKRARDFADIKYDGKITTEVAKNALDLMNVDTMGLDIEDRRILECVITKFGGGPVGLETLGVAISEDAGTLEEVYEPYLIQNGLLQRTPRGRVATRRAFEHMGYAVPENLKEM
ncbi:MAG: Holliday junction branch migration DNA helicase RuvB [Lachnospiraceae bacterium]|jgi:Holliday junction DNA helicase RuvB|nr:Holliday junction branch migration DNA helicase RuvB [Lachnospiraceae bacterium]